MTRREAIEAHWPIFKECYLTKEKTQILPEGPALVAAFCDYLDGYHHHQPVVAPEPPEGADQ